MSLTHDWLSPAEQAIMDATTSSASHYGYILATNWAIDLIVRRTGEFRPGDTIGISRLTDVPAAYGLSGFWLGRITEAQRDALIASGAEVVCRPDPTGEYWGNILLDLAKMEAGAHDHLCNPHSNAKMAVSFVTHGSWGATFADVEAMRQTQAAARAANAATPVPCQPEDDEGYKLSDFPAGYVAWFREEQMARDATDDEVLEELLAMGDDPMTCTRDVIDLNVMGGVHFVPGSAPVDRARQTHGMDHVGFMASTAIFIEADDTCHWDVTDYKHPSTKNGYARVNWCRQNATGPWLLIQGDWNERAEKAPLYLFLLNSGDQARFDAEFPFDVRAHDPRPVLAMEAKQDAGREDDAD